MRKPVKLCAALVGGMLTIGSLGQASAIAEDRDSGNIGEAQMSAQWQSVHGTPDDVPASAYADAVSQAQRLQLATTPGATSSTSLWTSLGPTSIKNGQGFENKVAVSGRVTDIAVSGATIFVGGADGGVWRSMNGGASWTVLTDKQATLAIGSIAVDPKNPKVIYAGTGEQHYSGDSYFGRGILKSTDGGNTWTLLGQSTFLGQHIGKVLVDPVHDSTVCVASDNGIYQSNNGGTTWTQVLKPNGDAVGLAMDPKNSQVLYAAVKGNGIWKTIDGGKTWNQLTNGLPSDGIGYMSIAVAPSDGNVLYSAFATDDEAGDELYGLYKSTDAGATWQQMALTPRYFDASYSYGWGSWGPRIGQGAYDNVIAVDPRDPNHVYAGGITLIESTNGGQTWKNLASPDSSDFAVDLHPDQHALTFDNSGNLYVGNDGGVWKLTSDGVWHDMNTNLGIMQFYPGLSQTNNGSMIMGGSQDNGTNAYKNGDWTQSYFGDGSYTAIDPRNSNVVYAESEIGDVERSDDGGNTWNWIAPNFPDAEAVPFFTPFILSPSNPDEILLGASRVYQSFDKGASWTAISPEFYSQSADNGTDTGNATNSGNSTLSYKPDPVAVIRQSTSDPKVIYVGTWAGQVEATFDGGQNWTAVTPQGIDVKASVAGIAIDPMNPKAIYVSYGGYDYSTQTNDHVYYTSDASAGSVQWKNLTGNLPNAPVDSLLLSNGTLYVGTDVGVFAATAGQSNWWSLNAGLPNTPVVDLLPLPNGKLVVATHGRGLFETTFSITGTLKLGNAQTTMLVKQSQQLHANVNGQDVTNASLWKSSNTYVATVTSTGQVKALHKGKVTVSATFNGKTVSMTIQVK